ncbi:unnamed protein product, partial [marine sediment metagenome]
EFKSLTKPVTIYTRQTNPIKINWLGWMTGLTTLLILSWIFF